MSRLPPLPPGLPPKPGAPAIPYGDSYRPGFSQVENFYPHGGNRESMYQFHGSYDQRQRSPAPYSYAPGTAPPRGPASSTYRPQDAGFNFRYDAPPSIDFRHADTYRPRSPPRQRNFAQDNNRSFKQNQHVDNQRYQGGARGGYRGRSGPRMASDRAFLKGNRAPTPELMLGMDEDENHGIRYKAIEDLSDSDEAEMDVSDDENGDAQQPRRKQARTVAMAVDGNSVPQWSNPDPYTALPPPDESLRKKKDVVKLIRKARVIATSENAVRAEAAADDFISFDFGSDPNENADEDEDRDDRSIDKPGTGVSGAPTGPRYSHRDNIQKHEAPSAPKSAISKSFDAQTRETKAHDSKLHIKSVESLGFNFLDATPDPSLGNRKRNIRDEIKGPPLLHKTTKGKTPRVNGSVLREWRVPSGSNGTPWLGIDHSDTVNMGLWLHKEIVDFYHYVKPTDFEQFIRTKLIEDLQVKVRGSFKDADIRCFGSFPAGLYLPTADMDLVCVSDQFMNGGRRVYGERKDIRRFERFLNKHNVAIDGSMELIFGAKVPLVKYVDKLTGLKVDISFENDTGLIANKTFQRWKTQFPAMPILVTLIKHLLAMRGLNEPVNGGIGGFSVTCLVVSLLQNMPQVQSKTMIPEHHLGEILMEFFDLYGHQFNTETTAIQCNPPGYVSKAYNRDIVYKATNRLSIIDPNNPNNDIAGGSSNTETVLKCFSQAYINLQKRMGELQFSANRRNQSILGCILAGDYSSFELQRNHLAHVHEKLFGPVSKD